MGYRMIHGLLVADGWPVNKKRIERLWRREGLQLPPTEGEEQRPQAGGDDSNSSWRLPPRYRNHIWTYDFIKRRTSDGRPFRVLNVVDEFTRIGLGSHVARSIGAKSVQALAQLFAVHGKPTLIRADNGREFIAKASPWQNGYGERFNGTMEHELFGHEVYHSILEVQHVVDEWTWKYNHRRPHRSLGGKTRPPTPRCSARTRCPTRMVVANERHYHHTKWTSRRWPSKPVHTDDPNPDSHTGWNQT
ncbi:integrase core domain-containing protein [Nocardioides dilutus]